jgi:BASS family bile acid:Na+ symporter
MQEVIIDTLKIIAPLSVALIVFAQGLSTTPNLVASYFKQRPRLMLRSLAVVLVIVPLAALAVIVLLRPAPATAVGLAILMACPPAPLMLQAGPKKGRASRAFMASLHLSLSTLAFFSVPAVLYLLSLPLGFRAGVELGAMYVILARTILAPLSLGLVVRAFFPELADRVGLILSKVGMSILLVVVLFATAAIYPALLRMDVWSYVVIAVVSVVALLLGHWLGPDEPTEKTALALECGVRHPALALAIGAANFTRERALLVLVPCVVTFVVVATLYLAWRGRSAPRGRAGHTPAASSARARV